MVGFGVLGPLLARRGDEELVLPGRRHRAVLARLLVARGAVVPVDRLIDDLWGQEQPAQAMAAVQTFVARLRRVIEPDRAPRTPARLLITAPPGYALRPEPGLVDAARFETLIGEAGAAPDEQAGHLLDEALALWRGPAFAEFAGEGWARGEAARLEELRLHAVEQRAGVRLRSGRAAEVAAELEPHVDAHPLRERGWAVLAEALYATGRQGDALASLRRARQVFRHELGVDPGPVLRRLQADILAHAEHLTPPRVTRAVARPRSVFVGRDDELARLVAQADTGGLALVTGEPGAGKSRLLTELEARLTARGALVGRGLCPQTEGAPPGWAAAEAIRQLAARRPPEGRLPAELCWVLDSHAAPDSCAAVPRFQMHRAVRDYLVELSGHGPVAVLIDDLHWADEETLAIAAALAGAGRLLLVLAYRPADAGEPVADTLAGLARRLPSRIELAGLGVAAVAEILASICTTEVDPDTVATITRRTGGNPFFVYETARLLNDEGIDTAVSAVPAGVRDVLNRRIARLPEVARTVLTHAAVLGRDIDLDVLVELTGEPEDAVLDAVEAAQLLGLLADAGPGRVGFGHALVRDAVYAGISPLRRGRLHARAAAAIERIRPNDVGALAHHFDASGDPNLAAQVDRYARLAADAAQRHYGYREAATLWRRALVAFDATGGPPAQRLDLLLAQVRALALADELGRARALRRETLDAAEAIGDPLLTARAIAAFDVPTAWTTRPYGQIDAQLLERSERTLGELPPGDSAPRCQLLTGIALELDGADDERGRTAALESVAMARRLGDPALLAMALNGALMQSFWLGSLPRRAVLGEELITLSQRHGLAASEQVGRIALANVAAARGEFTAADEHMAVVERLAKDHDQRVMMVIVSGYRGQRNIVAGELKAALAAYGDAARRLSRIRTWQEPEDAATATVGTAYLSLGAASKLADLWGAADSFATTNYPEFYALALAHARRVAQARAAAGPPAPIRKDYFWDLKWAVRGLLGAKIGDRDRMDAAYRNLAPFADLIVGGLTCIQVIGPVAQVLGDIAAARGEAAVASAHYRHAAAVARRCGAGLWEQAAFVAASSVR